MSSLGLIAYIMIPHVHARIDAPEAVVERYVVKRVAKVLGAEAIPRLVSEQLQQLDDVEAAVCLALREDGYEWREDTEPTPPEADLEGGQWW